VHLVLAELDIEIETFEGLAMASPLRIFVAGEGDRRAAITAAVAVVAAYERACSRFDPSSDLSLLNAAPNSTQVVVPPLLDALSAAFAASTWSAGRFDPRVLSDLERLGYDRTFSSMVSPRELAAAGRRRDLWRPTIDPAAGTVCLGGTPVDLGGIAKGLAADRAAAVLAAGGFSGIVDLGGDGIAVPAPTSHRRWQIGVEDPDDGAEPVAVVELKAGAWATSSTRVRRWRVGEQAAHHLIDPVTGEPGGAGLRSVTVLASTVAEADVLAKVAFLEGVDRVASFCQTHDLAALWIDEVGSISMTSSFEAAIIWTRD
jgi:FAD:protein FMN transferase